MIEKKERYLHLNKWLKDKFGERVLKICVDAGFSCPNRDGTCGKGGCIFCSERGSGEHIKIHDVKQQVLNHLSSYRGQRANKFIVYFQNFSNTYDNVENLKKKYDSAFVSEKIVGLAIATRPDCINEEIAKLLKSYTEKYFVYVELGLQTANENTALLINRGYKNDVFTKAVEILNKYNIPVVVHIMVGLPNENKKDIKNTINFINLHKVQGIKIHSTYIVENTKLNELYLNGSYIPLKLEEYIENVGFIIASLRQDIVIHRLSGDAPKEYLVAPEWNKHKKWIINGIEKYLLDNDIWQGKYYKKKSVSC